jgi:hypothetical protein
MTVSTFTQPDNTTQTGSAYKTAIDGAIHVHHRVAGAFACHQQDGNSPDAPDMTVVVDAGALVRAGLVPLEIAQQSTSAMTAPSGNPRRDIVYIDNSTGAVGVATGAEAVSPSDPAVPAGKTAVARVRLTVGMTEITNADIDDLRVSGASPEMTGPDVAGSPQLPGTAGIVSAPQPGDETKFWRGDATWAAAADQVARDMAASAMALADANGVAGPVGAFYLADPFTSDTLAVKTNATYDSANDWYTTLNLITGGTNIGDMTNGGGLAAAFDGVTSQTGAASARKAVTAAGFANTVGKQHSGAKLVKRVTFYGPSDEAFLVGFASQIRLEGSNDGSAWTTLTTQNTTTATGEVIDVTSGLGSTSYSYHRANLSGNSASGSVAELRMYEAANATLRASPVSLLVADPVDIMAYFLFDPVDAVTMGTDVIGKVSIADGSPEDFVTGTWTQVGTYGNFELWRLDVDMTGKTGSTLEYSIETANNKEIRLKQCVGLVPLY